jgi:Tol biopolymer transport system component
MKSGKFILLAALISLLLCFYYDASAQTQTQTITLRPGFNFIGFTNAPAAATPAQFKQLNATAIEDIYLFSAAAGSFLSMSEGSLTSLAAGKGYIVKSISSENVTLNSSGAALTTVGNITLKAGFNLVGFSKAPATAVKFSQLMNSYPLIRGIYKWSPAAGSFVQVVQNDGVPVLLDGTDPEFKAGESYFIKVSADTFINYDGASITMDQSASAAASIVLSGAMPSMSASTPVEASVPEPGAGPAARAIAYGTDFELAVIDMNTMSEIPAQISISGGSYSAKITASASQSYSAVIVLRHKTSQKTVYSAIAGQLPLKSAMGNIETIAVSGVNISAESSAIAALARDKKITPPAVAVKDSVSDIAAETKTLVNAIVGETIAVEFLKAMTTIQAVVASSSVSAESRSALCAKMDLTVKDVLSAYSDSLKLSETQAIISSTPGAASSVIINQTTINNSTTSTDIENASINIKIVVQPADIKAAVGTELTAITFPAGVSIKNSSNDLSLSYGAVTWQADSTPSYNKNAAGTYVFSGAIAGTSLKAFQRVILSAVTEAPVFTPASSMFVNSCQVTITSATKDAVIRYTLDNSTPTASSTQYAGPLELTSSAVIRAIATKTGLSDSSVVTARYTKENISGMITFLSYRDTGIGELYTVNADGTALTRLTSTDNHNGLSDISPDGMKIIFSAAKANSSTQYGGAMINAINSDGSGLLQQLHYEDGTRSIDPSYSKDGSKIVFVRQISSAEARIAVMDADGKNLTDIFTMNPVGNGVIKSPEFSPDGSKIIFTYEDSWASKYELYSITSSGGAKTLIADKAVNARFAPDGKIIYCEYGATANRGIIRCAADGSGSEVLIPYSKIWGSNYFNTTASCPFDISPDGAYIALVKKGEMYLARTDGFGEIRQITTIASCGGLRWSAGGSGFTGRTPSELKLCSDTGTLTNQPAEITGSLEKVIVGTIYPLINVKTIAFFENSVLVNNTYQKMRQWIDPVWSVVSGAGKIGGDLYKYFTAPATASDTVIKATYTESGKTVSAEFTMRSILFNTSGKIYFSSNKDGVHEIYRCDYNGANALRLTNHLAYTHSPAVSPDGSKVAYVTGSSSLNYGDREIYVMNSDGSGAVRITNNSVINYGPSFSPDGRTICYGEDGKIMTAAADGSGTPAVVTGATDVSNVDPMFTADGSSIIFSSSHKEGSFYVTDGHFTIPAGGGTRTQISTTALDNAGVTSGGKIAYARSGKLYTMNTDGSGVLELLASFDGTAPVFSPDGVFVMYEKSQGGISDLWAVASDGSGEKIRVTNGDLGAFATQKIAWSR